MTNGFAPVSRSVVSQRGRLNYVDWGNAGAPTLLLIHGSRDHARSWDWVARALREAWHVVAVDLRGHGDSDWSSEGRYDFATYLYDMVQLLGALGDGPVVVVAHSLGAHIGLRLAGLCPERIDRLVAVEAVGPPPPADAASLPARTEDGLLSWIARKQAAEARSRRRYPDLVAAAGRMRAENPRLSAEQARHLTLHGTRPNGDGSWSWKFDDQLRIWPYPDIPEADVDALLRGIRCPVMLLYGRESWPSDVPARLRATLPRARHVEIDGAAHWPHHDRLATFVTEVRRFLTD